MLEINATGYPLKWDREAGILHVFPAYSEGPRSFCPWCAFDGGRIEELLPILGVAFALECVEVHIHLGDPRREYGGPTLFREKGKYLFLEEWKQWSEIHGDGCLTVPKIPRVKWVGAE